MKVESTIMKRILYLSILICLSSQLKGQLYYTGEDLPCINKTFKIHVHLVLDSLGKVPVNMAELEGACETANEKFAPICARFEICQVDTIINYNFDSIPYRREYDELAVKYGHKNRINIFISSTTFIEHADSIQPICGLGGNHIWLSCLPALSHELGHFFGLAHTFEGSGEEMVDGSNCETHGDKICDTPADPYVIFTDLSLYINSNCEFNANRVDANGDYYIPHTGNIMSYYGCPCQEFSRGQFLRMVETYNQKYKRLW